MAYQLTKIRMEIRLFPIHHDRAGMPAIRLGGRTVFVCDYALSTDDIRGDEFGCLGKWVHLHLQNHRVISQIPSDHI